MTNWYKQLILLLATASSVGIEAPSSTANDVGSGMECQDLNAAYQKVYSFETENYYINVCQLDSNFYYHRQSKFDNNSNILVPAETVFREDVFQASVGKITYFVGVDSDRHYSSVMLNNNEIVFEPEIESTVPNIAESEYSLQNASLELDTPPESESVLVCTREQSAFQTGLNGWQKLIGSSTRSARKYAVNNGHNFDYDRAKNPNLASIATESATIDLNIAPKSEIVEQVCLDSNESK